MFVVSAKRHTKRDHDLFYLFYTYPFIAYTSVGAFNPGGAPALPAKYCASIRLRAMPCCDRQGVCLPMMDACWPWRTKMICLMEASGLPAVERVDEEVVVGGRPRFPPPLLDTSQRYKLSRDNIHVPNVSLVVAAWAGASASAVASSSTATPIARRVR